MSLMKKKENKEVNDKRQVFKNAALGKRADQLGPYVLIGIWSVMTGINIVSALGGMTVDEWSQKTIPLTVDFFRTSSDGSFVGRDVQIRIQNYVPPRDLEVMLKRNMTPDRLLYYRKLNLAYKTVIDINSFGGCVYESTGPAGKIGMVMVRVTIEGEECAKDNFAFNGGGTLPMYSSISHTKVLEAGEYDLLIEILYFGCLDNYRSSMELKLTRHSDVTYRDYAEVKKKEYLPVRNGKITIENAFSPHVPGPVPGAGSSKDRSPSP
ncbi:MAG: hypothetical protein GY940_47675, partial [bacterium]|nr:hypothetical protein [bacterium]